MSDQNNLVPYANELAAHEPPTIIKDVGKMTQDEIDSACRANVAVAKAALGAIMHLTRYYYPAMSNVWALWQALDKPHRKALEAELGKSKSTIINSAKLAHDTRDEWMRRLSKGLPVNLRLLREHRAEAKAKAKGRTVKIRASAKTAALVKTLQERFAKLTTKGATLIAKILRADSDTLAEGGLTPFVQALDEASQDTELTASLGEAKPRTERATANEPPAKTPRKRGRKAGTEPETRRLDTDDLHDSLDDAVSSDMEGGGD